MLLCLKLCKYGYVITKYLLMLVQTSHNHKAVTVISFNLKPKLSSYLRLQPSIWNVILSISDRIVILEQNSFYIRIHNYINQLNFACLQHRYGFHISQMSPCHPHKGSKIFFFFVSNSSPVFSSACQTALYSRGVVLSVLDGEKTVILLVDFYAVNCLLWGKKQMQEKKINTLLYIIF